MDVADVESSQAHPIHACMVCEIHVSWITGNYFQADAAYLPQRLNLSSGQGRGRIKAEIILALPCRKISRKQEHSRDRDRVPDSCEIPTRTARARCFGGHWQGAVIIIMAWQVSHSALAFGIPG